MAKVNRTSEVKAGGEVRYTIMCNIVVEGSKKMAAGQQDAHVENEPDQVKVSITDASDPSNVLGEAVVDMSAFKADAKGKASIGYKWNVRDARFHTVE